jgi:hypothetical protein
VVVVVVVPTSVVLVVLVPSTVVVVVVLVTTVVLVVVGTVLVVAVVLVVGGAVVVVVRTHWQSSPHSGPNRWPARGGHCAALRLHGGSHSSPASSTPLPHAGSVVVVLAAAVVVVVWVTVVVVDVVPVVVVTPAHASTAQLPSPTSTPPSSRHSTGFSSSQPSSSDPGSGRQHCVSCSTPPAGKQPCSTASHQLANPVTQAVPPRGAVHLAAGTTVHLVRPRRFVRQHVTHPLRPQVDFTAHFITWCICFRARRPAATSAFSACTAQRT